MPLLSAMPAYSLNVRTPALSYTFGSTKRSSLPTAERSGIVVPMERNFSSTRIRGWKEMCSGDVDDPEGTPITDNAEEDVAEIVPPPLEGGGCDAPV